MEIKDKDHKTSAHPEWILGILKSFCPDYLYEEIAGDLVQGYKRDVVRYGETKAKRIFFWNSIRFFRPGVLFRNKVSFESNHLQMISSYFKMAYRQMLKGKAFSIINVAGLSVGITAFFLIVQYVSFEMTYDRWTGEDDKIYRVAYHQFENGEMKNTSAKNFIGIRSLMKEHFPEIKNFTGMAPIPSNANFLFGYKGKIYFEKGWEMRADSSFFKVFNSLLLKGNPSAALAGAHSLAISESMAKKVFGDVNVIGKELDELGDEKHVPYTITAVFRDLPENSHFHASFITNFAKYGEWDVPKNYWNGPDYYTYFKVEEGTDAHGIEDRLNMLIMDLGRQNQKMAGVKVIVQPIESIHLESHLGDEMEANGNKSIVFGLMLVGLLILVMAWINYINMETARFMRRAREVGVRRIIGSGKSDLALQFLVEYFCVNLLSVGVAFLLLQVVLPNFSYLTGIPITQLDVAAPPIWFGALGCFLLGSILVGIYPSLFLLRLNPVASMLI